MKKAPLDIMDETSVHKQYHCGTLKYSLFQLGTVFFWMLWGAVAMTMLGATFNAATPFLFRANGLSDTFIAVVLGTVFSWMNTILNPILSTASDRCRSRWGRRIPYILYTAFPVAIFLAAMPFYPKLLRLLPATAAGVGCRELFFGAGAILYHFSYLFIAIIYFYLIPDVIPQELMGRYYGFFRVAGVAAGTFFSKFIFPLVNSRPQIIYPGVALFYLVSILAVCYFVREGKYPEPEKKLMTRLPLWRKAPAVLREYTKECFCSRYYWCFYMVGVAAGLSGCVNIFMNFFYLDGCQMSMAKIGELGVYIGIVTMVSCFLAGFLVDKMDSFQAKLIALAAMGLCYFGGGIFIRDLPSALFWRVPLAVFSGISAVASGRMLVEVFPRSKFGMIASGQNLLTAFFVGVAAYPVGRFSDFLKCATPETTLKFFGYDLMPFLRGYRFVNYWAGTCLLLSTAILLYFYLFYQRRRKDRACDL